MARYLPEKNLWRCPCCERELPGEDFQLYRRSATGRLCIAHACKECTAERVKKEHKSGNWKRKPERRLKVTRSTLDYFSSLED